ncbi:Glutathione S-transferase, C-terminal domain protein [Burkholderia cenocepacia HI2424]|nr:Glutathione S-transferase, C-terminal domain protein [Burkholderia cenocepacia HI2424]
MCHARHAADIFTTFWMETGDEALRICRHPLAAGAVGAEGTGCGFRIRIGQPARGRAQAARFPAPESGRQGAGAGGRRPRDSRIGRDRAVSRGQVPGEGAAARRSGAAGAAYRWIMFAVTELEQPLWRITRHTFLYPPEKRSPADIELAREDFMTMAAILDTHLEGREFIVGDSLTVADCVTAYLIDWASECHLIEPFPQLRAYLERLYARPKAPQRIADARKAA